MSVSSLLPRPSRQVGRATATLGSLLLALAVSSPARAVTTVSVDDHPEPVTLLQGETVTIRFDVSKVGGVANFWLYRDVTGTGKFDLSLPTAASSALADGGQGDVDPDPGKIAIKLPVGLMPSGPYFARVLDPDNTALEVPGWSIAPKPEAQGIAGRVVAPADAGPLQDANIWTYSDPQTPVASAHVRPDGSYSLPVPAGTYIVFAEWFGNLRSQRQVVTVAPGQTRASVDLPLLRGQEVAGTLKDDAGSPLAGAPVQATAADGAVFTTQTFADGSYLLVLPSGSYSFAARGLTRTVAVADGPVDGVSIPAPPPAPTPAVGTILTVVGSGIQGFGGDGGPALNARISTVGSLAVDRADNLYFPDSGPNRVRKVSGGIVTTFAGSGTPDIIRGLSGYGNVSGFSGDGGAATAAQFNLCQHVAVDKAGNIYITDTRNHRIRRVDTNGVITTYAGSGPVGQGKGSTGGDGGPATEARINSPQDIAVDLTGNLYIAERTFGKRIRKVAPDGTITTFAGGGTNPMTEGTAAASVALGAPSTVTVDLAGNVYFADATLNRIFKVTPAGSITTVAGTGTAGYSGDGGPATAAQIVVTTLRADSAGNLFFSDGLNHRIRKIGPDGTITTVVGSGPVFPVPGSFAGDGGPATGARLWGPGGLAIHSAGNLLFVDGSNRRIRKVIGIAAPGLLAGQ